MKYNIISINDDRLDFKNNIRQVLGTDELSIPAVNASSIDIMQAIKDRGLELKEHVWDNSKTGELGVWLSNYDCWRAIAEQDEPVVVFEDDAIPDSQFNAKCEGIIEDAPDGWDFISLWVPDNQKQDYFYNNTYDSFGDPIFHGKLDHEHSVYRVKSCRYSALVYQGYGMVSLVYSPLGAKKLVSAAHTRGIDNPIDCWIYQEAHKGNLNGYAPRPEYANIVHYDWSAQSHVQNTERLK